MIGLSWFAWRDSFLSALSPHARDYVADRVRMLRARLSRPPEPREFLEPMDKDEDAARFDASYYSHPDGAPIGVAGGGWVYVVVHSFHQHDDEPPEKPQKRIGDLSLAIDHQGVLYETREHVCGGLTLQASTPEGFASIEEFRRSIVYHYHDRQEDWTPFSWPEE
ncbi:MAG: hypothetical protein HY720_21380 [Planctomycetes bacterium]|nr:hypothetical protein [Planctomycetota bacterium]